MTNEGARLVHATAVRVGSGAVLLRGASGTGKTMLALALIAEAGRRGVSAALISDDQTFVRPTPQGLEASAPERLRDQVELRGYGIVAINAASGAWPVRFVGELVRHEPDRWQADCTTEIEGHRIAFAQLPAADRWRACLICLAALTVPPGL